jgi:hypothetical protein
MSFATRVADLAHKAVVTTCLSLFAFQAYQLGSNMYIGTVTEQYKKEHPQKGFIDMLREQYENEYKKYFDTGHRDWYDKDDNSYLEKVPKPQDYQPGGQRRVGG